MSFLSVLLPLLLAFEPVQYSLAGKVVDGTDGSPLVAADVIVTDMDDRILAYGTTGGDGFFRLDLAAEGDWLLLIKMMGYDS